jgi:hypothetical protein
LGVVSTGDLPNSLDADGGRFAVRQKRRDNLGLALPKLDVQPIFLVSPEKSNIIANLRDWQRLRPQTEQWSVPKKSAHLSNFVTP